VALEDGRTVAGIVAVMPEGLEKIISPRDMADLIAFLLQVQN
jgi:hypothetical protein